MKGSVVCPGCGAPDQVEKVSTVYLLGIGLKQKIAEEKAQLTPVSINPVFLEMPAEELRQLSRKLAPPSSNKVGFSRPIHPDVFVLTFSLILPFFLFGIYTSQRNVLLPMLAILAGFVAWYVWKRKAMIARYERQQTERKSAEERTKHGVERWLKLYYCLEDDSIFEKGSQDLTPASEIGRLLNR